MTRGMLLLWALLFVTSLSAEERPKHATSVRATNQARRATVVPAPSDDPEALVRAICHGDVARVVCSGVTDFKKAYDEQASETLATLAKKYAFPPLNDRQKPFGFDDFFLKAKYDPETWGDRYLEFLREMEKGAFAPGVLEKVKTQSLEAVRATIESYKTTRYGTVRSRGSLELDYLIERLDKPIELFSAAEFLSLKKDRGEWLEGVKVLQRQCTRNGNYTQAMVLHRLSEGTHHVIFCPGFLFERARTAARFYGQELPLSTTAPFSMVSGHELGHMIGLEYTIDGTYAGMQDCLWNLYGKRTEFLAALKSSRTGEPFTQGSPKETPMSELVADYWGTENLAASMRGLSPQAAAERFRASASNFCRSKGGDGYVEGHLRIEMASHNPSIRRALGCRAGAKPKSYCAPHGEVPSDI